MCQLIGLGWFNSLLAGISWAWLCNLPELTLCSISLSKEGKWRILDISCVVRYKYIQQNSVLLTQTYKTCYITTESCAWILFTKNCATVFVKSPLRRSTRWSLRHFVVVCCTFGFFGSPSTFHGDFITALKQQFDAIWPLICSPRTLAHTGNT